MLVITLAFPVNWAYNIVALSDDNPDCNNFCGTKIESIKLIIVPTVAPTDIGNAILNMADNTSGLLLTFLFHISFLTFLYFSYK